MKRLKQHTDPLAQYRLVKLLLPGPLIRALDELLVEGTGGFSTRNEFIREAIESYMLELTHELAPAEPAEFRNRRHQLRSVPGARHDKLEHSEPQRTVEGIALSETALPATSPSGPTIAGEAQVVDEPLFGMHNRDYPSLWAASRLAEYLGYGAVNLQDFTERVTDEAWAYADSLRRVELESTSKLTALFPTNYDKRQAASGAFVTFAIGSAVRTEGHVRAEGPLFLWRVIDVAQREATLEVGLLQEGRELLTRLAGMTVEQPHPEAAARIFLAHLSEHATADYWGFEKVMRVVEQTPTRAELIGAFQSARPDWRESVAATNAQGYVARAREWGLIAPKVVEGRYQLTEFGRDVLQRGPVA